MPATARSDKIKAQPVRPTIDAHWTRIPVPMRHRWIIPQCMVGGYPALLLHTTCTCTLLWSVVAQPGFDASLSRCSSFSLSLSLSSSWGRLFVESMIRHPWHGMAGWRRRLAEVDRLPQLKSVPTISSLGCRHRGCGCGRYRRSRETMVLPPTGHRDIDASPVTPAYPFRALVSRGGYIYSRSQFLGPTADVGRPCVTGSVWRRIKACERRGSILRNYASFRPTPERGELCS